MSFTILIKDVFNSLGRGLEVTMTKLEEFNNEQKEREPFRVVKRQALHIKHIAHIASIVIPDSYTSTHTYISVVIYATDIVINFMDATIDHPDQRNDVLDLIKTVRKERMTEFDKTLTELDKMMEELYTLGLDYNAPIGDKIRFILELQSEEKEIEKIMQELIPMVNATLQKMKNARISLQRKGYVTY